MAEPGTPLVFLVQFELFISGTHSQYFHTAPLAFLEKKIQTELKCESHDSIGFGQNLVCIQVSYPQNIPASG